MNQEPRNRKPRHFRPAFWLAVAIGIAAVIAIAVVSRTPNDYRYGFITADHPIDVMQDRGGRWFYYMPPPVNGGASGLAAAARNELIPQGFTEDTSNTPWFRFVKGDREVIVCNHDEIGTTGNLLNEKVIHGFPSAIPQSVKCPVVWVHQPGTSASGVELFQAKKLVFRW